MPKKKRPSLNLDALVASQRAAREAMGEQAWLEYQEQHKRLMAETIIKTKRDFDAFVASPEGKAREALRLNLEMLKHDDLIRQSETCIEVLDAFIYCVTYRWGAADSGGMLDPFDKHFATERNRQHAQRRGEPLEAYRVLLDGLANEKAAVRKAALRAQFEISAAQAHDIHRNWREWRKRTQAGIRSG